MNHWAATLTIDLDVDFDFPFLGGLQKQGEGVLQPTRYVGSSY